MKALSLLESEMIFGGQGFDEPRDALCEIVFNSVVYGHTGLLTGPSCAGQGVVMTYLMVGNYGICYEDAEADHPWVEAFIVHSVSGIASNSRCDIDLDGYLENNRIPGISGIDTRAFTRCLRESGTVRGILCFDNQTDRDEMKHKIAAHVVPNGVSQISIRKSRDYGNGSVGVALLDYDTKENIIRSLTHRGCAVCRFPNNTPFEEIKAWDPDGVMLSNGPRDLQACVKEVTELKRIYQNGIPTFTICVRCQLMVFSQDVNAYKFKYGHYGINHPMKELKTNHVYIISRSHGYVVGTGITDPSITEISYVSTNDQNVEDLDYKNDRVFSVQFHPETCPGPLDTGFLFDRFMGLMGGGRI